MTTRLLLLAAWGCTARVTAGESCSAATFAAQPGEHITSVQEKPLSVRSVKDVVHSAAGDWPTGTVIRFELVRQGPQSASRATRGDSQGRFSIGHVGPGEYCYRASAVGWQSVIGRLVVSRDGPTDPIQLTLALGI